MIPIEKIPELKALWAEADAAFRADDAYVVEMAEESAKVYARRKALRARREAAAQAAADEERRERSRAQARRAYAEQMDAMTEQECKAWHRAKNGPRTERSRLEARERYAAKMAGMSPEERKAFHRAKNERAKAKRQGSVGGDA